MAFPTVKLPSLVTCIWKQPEISVETGELSFYVFRKRYAHKLIYSFNKYFLSNSCVPGVLLSVRDTI